MGAAVEDVVEIAVVVDGEEDVGVVVVEADVGTAVDVDEVKLKDTDDEKPPHLPNPPLHPSPQYANPSPQKKYSEQHGPKAEPAHVVEFPHRPFVLGVRVGNEVVVVLVLVLVRVVVEVVLTDVDVDVDAEVDIGASPHLPNNG
ncbi:hypothetical protein Ptr86124_011795 [Pyrenophora tritici-repentis]|uniref:Uncharacterized protein n=1 Tax=Pyrenophora tritici-repentis TaxID=45151 RepID=A0A922N505_9PLEO|nr:hypothetical protein Ptr86124_011795 [Pyrenophora tritici-repentis]